MAVFHPLTALLARVLHRRSRPEGATRRDASPLVRAPRVVRAFEAAMLFVAMSIYAAALLAGGYVVMLALRGG
jgi:hypothetical protein